MKQLKSGHAAREAILNGVRKLEEQVSATMGAKGRNILLEKKGVPVITKDGVTVAREIHLPDRFEDMGCQLVKQAANETNRLAGDGTTNSVVLAYSMMKNGMKKIKRGANAISMKRGMDKAKDSIIAQLNTMKKDVTKKEQLQAIATISSQDEEIGKVVADVISQVGKDGIVTSEASAIAGIESEVVEGMELDYPLVSPYFINNPKLTAVIGDTPILITDKRITHFKQILPILKLIKETYEVPRITIICKDMRDEALVSSVVNKQKGQLEIAVVKFPETNQSLEILEDVAKLTGATIISEIFNLRLEKMNLEQLGHAKKIIAGKDKITIIGGEGNIEERIEELKIQLEQEDNPMLRKRLAKLTNGVAVIRVGANTEVEQTERLHRVEDAINAAKAASEEGILAGGGTAYLRCVNNLKLTGDEETGAEIVFHAIQTTTEVIADNSGANGKKVREEVQRLTGNMGYNALTNSYENLMDSNVIDPTKVVRIALENAVSVASIFLTLEGAVCFIKPEEPGFDLSLVD